MIVAQQTEIRMAFDNPTEREEYARIYQNKGYEIIQKGSNYNTWYFVARLSGN